MNNFINFHATLSGDSNNIIRQKFIEFLSLYLELLRDKESDYDFASISLKWDDVTQTGDLRIVKNQKLEEREVDIDVIQEDINELSFLVSLKNQPAIDE